MNWLFQRILRTMVLAAVWLPFHAAACAACFGQSDSPLAKGMNMGILTLLCIVGTVLIGMGAFFVFLMRRASFNSEVTVAETSAPEVATSPVS